jgi:hypothetical protein
MGTKQRRQISRASQQRLASVAHHQLMLLIRAVSALTFGALQQQTKQTTMLQAQTTQIERHVLLLLLLLLTRLVLSMRYERVPTMVRFGKSLTKTARGTNRPCNCRTLTGTIRANIANSSIVI